MATSSASNLPIFRLTIHCTDTPEGKPFTVARIRAMHIKRGWGDIGYHYLIGLNGEIGLGRKEATIPAAVKRYNKGMLAVAYVGGMGPDGKAKDTRTEAQKQAIAKLVQLLAHKHSLPVTSIYGHRDWDHKDRFHNGMLGPGAARDWLKECPCFEVSAERQGWITKGEAG